MSARQERDWRLYADDILQACAKVRHIVSGMTYETFVADEGRASGAACGSSTTGGRRAPSSGSSPCTEKVRSATSPRSNAGSFEKLSRQS
jgi:hypothetical protein